MLVASRAVEEPRSVVLAYDASPAADRALERLANSPLFAGLPIHVVAVGADDERHRGMLGRAAAELGSSRSTTTSLTQGKPEEAIADIVARTPGAMLVMGAYGHSPLRALIVGSTTTAVIRTVHVPVLLVR